jgi:hypothetical protein
VVRFEESEIARRPEKRQNDLDVLDLFVHLAPQGWGEASSYGTGEAKFLSLVEAHQECVQSQAAGSVSTDHRSSFERKVHHHRHDCGNDQDVQNLPYCFSLYSHVSVIDAILARADCRALTLVRPMTHSGDAACVWKAGKQGDHLTDTVNRSDNRRWLKLPEEQRKGLPA